MTNMTINHYGWVIWLKFYWFLSSNSQNLLLAHFLIRPILDAKFPLMTTIIVEGDNRSNEKNIRLTTHGILYKIY